MVDVDKSAAQFSEMDLKSKTADRVRIAPVPDARFASVLVAFKLIDADPDGGPFNELLRVVDFLCD